MERLILLIIFYGFIGKCIAQDQSINPPAVQKEVNISFGLARLSMSERRFSAAQHNSYAPIYKLSFQRKKLNSISSLDMSFFTNRPSLDDKTYFDLKILQAAIHYNYTRKVTEELFLGGYLRFYNLFSFPKTNNALFTNNPITYTIANSIGPAVKYKRYLGRSLFINGHFDLPLLSYVIRPAYGHPYPEKYLDESVFSPTRRGMAGPLLRSGKWTLPNAFLGLRLQFRAYIVINDHFKIGANLTFEYLHYRDRQSVKLYHTDLSLAIGYLY